jgi:hypothetical protein
MNEETLAHWGGLLRQKKVQLQLSSIPAVFSKVINYNKSRAAKIYMNSVKMFF